jgi:ABC-type transporter Mla subunit MlaD
VTRYYDQFAVNSPDDSLEGNPETTGVVPEETAREAWDEAIETLRGKGQVSTSVIKRAEQVAEALGWR